MRRLAPAYEGHDVIMWTAVCKASPHWQWWGGLESMAGVLLAGDERGP